MKNFTLKSVFKVVLFVSLLIFASMLHFVNIILPEELQFLVSLSLVVSTGILIGIFSYWTVSVYSRIMQSHVRTYLILIGVCINFWIAVRSIKWYAFRNMIFEDRLFWYLYYIPMILLPLFFFLTSLYVGENEDYRASKKWKLIFGPALLLVLLVLTNDFHKLAFEYDLTLHVYALDYNHGPVYYLVCIFVFSLVIMSIVVIVRKFKVSPNVRKAVFLPSLIIVCTLVYTALYIIKPSYGIGYYIDLTTFGCSVAVALLESFMKSGLIHSNTGYSKCFSMSDIRAQILSESGEVFYISETALPLVRENFQALKSLKTMPLNSNTLLHMEKIRGGYVAWSSDVSEISVMIKNLKSLNEKLYAEVDILSLENEQKSERARTEKLNDLHNIMLKEVLPFSQKIKSEMTKNSDMQIDKMKKLLFETGMTSTYIKRKVNLILTAQTENCINGDEMRRCFLESFQLLEFYGKTCVINIKNACSLSLENAIFSFDLYQSIIEKTEYGFDTIYITYNFQKDSIVFAVQISTEKNIALSDLDIKNVQILKENEGYHFSVTMIK